MNFAQESKSEDFSFYLFNFFFCGRGGGVGVGREGDFDQNKKTIGICLFFVLMLYIKFQIPGSSGSLVLTQTKGVTDMQGA